MANPMRTLVIFVVDVDFEYFFIRMIMPDITNPIKLTPNDDISPYPQRSL